MSRSGTLQPIPLSDAGALLEHGVRRRPVLELTRGEAERLLEPVLGPAQVEGLELLSGGYCNSNYRVLRAGARAAAVLRLYSRGPEACRKEWDVYRLLAGRVPVPALLGAAPEADPPYLVLEWIEGERLSDLLISQPEQGLAALPAVGASLAGIHAHCFPHAGLLGDGLSVPDPWDDAAAGYAAYARRCLDGGPVTERIGEPLATRLRAWVEDRLPLLAEAQEGRSLVHSDFKASNVLVRPGERGWQVAAVLDWEFAHSGHPLYDFGNFLRFERRLPPGTADGLAASYVAAGGVLPEGWRELARLFDLVNLFDFLESPDPPAELVAGIRELLEAYAALEVRVPNDR